MARGVHGGKPLNQIDAAMARRIRDGVNEELAGYVRPERVSLEDMSYTSLPPRGPEDNDLLTASLVKTMCEDMAENHVSLFVAGRAVGLPEKLLSTYVDRGNEDLCQGIPSRLAWFAVMTNRAEGRVQRSLVKGVVANPLGWMNLMNLLEKQWPEQFAIQRLALKKNAPPSIEGELNKLFNVAREGGGASIPTIDISTMGTSTINEDDVVEPMP